jgi:beta-galactosidase GanA
MHTERGARRADHESTFFFAAHARRLTTPYLAARRGFPPTRNAHRIAFCRWSAVISAVSTAVFGIVAAGADAGASSTPPHLRRQGSAAQLIVDGRPFIVRGGELGNSTGEPGYLRQFWPKLEALNLNTILAPVYWDVIEPIEGKFDFETVDGLISDARSHGVRLVLLWFASWKNSMSCYAPTWIKTDITRFPRAQGSAGRSLEILSPFSDNNWQADARAFAALMRRLREIDGEDHTVIMIQVENEIGMIPEARDRSAAADELFKQSVPRELLDDLRSRQESLIPELREKWAARGYRAEGAWEDVFGSGPHAAEIFMAWHFARYVNRVITAGKAEYPLPMFVNAALIRPGYLPGQYPSAGPLPHLIDVWRAGAPGVDFLSPDIYLPDFAAWCQRYARSGNPLFIPEARRDAEAAVHALYAIGAHDAIGFAPFGIESIDEPASSLLAQSNELIAQLTPLLAEHQGKSAMAGLLSGGAEQRQPQRVHLGGHVLNVAYEQFQANATTTVPAGGLVIAAAPDELVFAGIGLTITFNAPTPGDPIIGVLSVEEGRYDDGRWVHARWLNGDQTHQGRHVRLEPGRFTIQRVKLYRYR